MKPETWKSIQERLEENLRNMNNPDCLDPVYTEMVMENETMGWICLSEGKGKAFEKYQQKIGLQIEIEEQ